MARKKRIFTVQRDGAHATLDGVIVDLDTMHAVISFIRNIHSLPHIDAYIVKAINTCIGGPNTSVADTTG